jgi:hypothetical protein
MRGGEGVRPLYILAVPLMSEMAAEGIVILLEKCARYPCWRFLFVERLSRTKNVTSGCLCSVVGARDALEPPLTLLLQIRVFGVCFL